MASRAPDDGQRQDHGHQSSGHRGGGKGDGAERKALQGHHRRMRGSHQPFSRFRKRGRLAKGNHELYQRRYKLDCEIYWLRRFIYSRKDLTIPKIKY